MEYENGLGRNCMYCGGGKPQYYELRHTYTDVLAYEVEDGFLYIELSTNEPNYELSSMANTEIICSNCREDWPIDYDNIQGWEIE